MISFIKRCWVIVSLCLPAAALGGQWEEVDNARAAAGMISLNYSEALSVAAGNHAAYLVENLPIARGVNVSAHDESSSSPLFSGQSASERAIYAGYAHQQVTENISTGNVSDRESVRNLMSAIYHRFGFLSFDIDTIGIAEEKQRYVYNMGRSDLEQACTNPPLESKVQARVSCMGTSMRQDAYAQLCQNLPVDAHYQQPYAKQCPSGTRLNRKYVESLCASPPREALQKGAGRYYELCGNGVKFKASWFEGMCENPPQAAAYTRSGSYYALCEGYTADGVSIKVDADWYGQFCSNLSSSQQYLDSGRFYRPCANDTQIRAEYMDDIDFQLRRQNPEFVIWPASGELDIPPAFFEESPDPLPDLSVSGYPISLQLNPSDVKVASIVQFNLERYAASLDGGVASWQTVSNIRFIDASNDPNQKFSELQFVWFPLNRLAWNTDYRVSISAIVDGNTQQFYSEFRTEDLGVPMQQVYPDTQLIRANDGEWQALYQAPSQLEPNPFQNVNFSYPAGGNVEIELLDMHTVKLRVSRVRCGPVQLALSSGRQIEIKTCG